MFRVTKVFEFSYGHRLLEHKGRCRHLHGHNGRAEIDIEAPDLDGRAMVEDFSEIKETIGRWIEERIDHKVLLRRDDPLAKALIDCGEPVLTLDGNPTAENLARMIYEFAAGRGLAVREVRVWETPTSVAAYSGPTPGGG